MLDYKQAAEEDEDDLDKPETEDDEAEENDDENKVDEDDLDDEDDDPFDDGFDEDDEDDIEDDDEDDGFDQDDTDPDGPAAPVEDSLLDGLDTIEPSGSTTMVGLFGGPEAVIGLDDLRDQIDPSPASSVETDSFTEMTPSMEERVEQFRQRDEDLRLEIDQMADSLLGLVSQMDGPARRPNASDILTPHRVNYIDAPEMSHYSSKKPDSE